MREYPAFFLTIFVLPWAILMVQIQIVAVMMPLYSGSVLGQDFEGWICSDRDVPQIEMLWFSLSICGIVL